jgi:lycopene beta-cyclase
VPQAVQVDDASRPGPIDVDVALVGAGGAGLGVVVALDRLAGAHRAAGREVTVPTVAVVDPVVRAGADRTWCFWDAGRSDLEEAVHRRWRHVVVVGPDDERRVHDLDPLRYAMVRSTDFYALADAAARRIGAVRVTRTVSTVTDDVDRAVVHTSDGPVRARWVFDSRPAPRPLRRANTALLQHFRGWTVVLDPAAGAALDPDVAVLMDFTTPQPRNAVSFGYVLPVDARRALVEYTEFSRARLPGPAYDEALRRYLVASFGEAGRLARVEEVEDGAIPMTDAVLATRTGARTFRIGTAGGATRPSTGYTFAAMQRQAAAIARALLDGRTPQPPPAYPARHRWMDAVLLRALDRGHVRGADLFSALFARNRPADVLRFLDGGTSVREDVALMLTAPALAMSRAAVGDAAARLRRRAARPRS